MFKNNAFATLFLGRSKLDKIGNLSIESDQIKEKVLLLRQILSEKSMAFRKDNAVSIWFRAFNRT